VNESEYLDDRKLVRAFLDATSRMSDPEAGALAGVSHTTIGRWKAGEWKQLQAANRRRLEDYLADARAKAPPFAPTRSERPTADDRAIFEEVKGILRDQDIPPGLRILLIDAATSAWTKAALYRGEVASEERARAVHQAEVTQAARTEAIREVERGAGERFRVLRPGADERVELDQLPPLRHPPESSGGKADQKDSA